MTTESCENNSNNGGKRVTSTTAKNPAAEQEQLPCPRCESTNTKFCYYNNYNFSQPRHFCKACRRYWTHGGTLRDIPVGGGTRKNAKRCRTIPSTTPISSNHNMSMNMMTATVGGNGGSALQEYPLHATPVLVPFEGSSAQLKTGHMNGPTFASLLSTQGPGFLALGGFGLGLGSGFVADGGYGGLGRGFWGLTEGGAGAGAGAAAAHGGAIAAGGINGNAWQFESGEATPTSAFGTADCFSWPDLAISTPGNSLK